MFGTVSIRIVAFRKSTMMDDGMIFEESTLNFNSHRCIYGGSQRPLKE